MPRIRHLVLLAVVTALLVMVTSLPLRAIGPAILMFYGGDLKEPVLVFPGNPSYNPTGFIWNPANGGVPYARKHGTLPPNLEGRRYISVGIFWGGYDPATLKPSDASQHGRIYVKTASAPAVIVITAPQMANPKDPAANPEPVPVPTSLDEFISGWTTTVDIGEWIRNQTEHAAK
ncbi:MAG TPA: hypothetical protein VFT24_04190 [Vicinamibacterales bacterium]|nr:hypothetical protein [Vicinamibacterales bacterium]